MSDFTKHKFMQATRICISEITEVTKYYKQFVYFRGYCIIYIKLILDLCYSGGTRSQRTTGRCVPGYTTV